MPGLTPALVIWLIGQTPAAQPAGATAQADWARVLAIQPGEEIKVSSEGQPSAQAIFVRADERHLTTLNVDPPHVGDGVRALLRASFTAGEIVAAAGGREVSANGVSFGPRGLVVERTRVADTADVVRMLPKERVREVAVRGKGGRRGWGIALLVMGAGMTIGNLVGLSAGSDSGSSNVGQDGYLGVTGVVVGGSLAFMGGYLVRTSRNRTIYKAVR